ncbi:MAG: DHA2 family efflux MFS transporter permease subunit [Corynebacterium sp.]|uniref:DHA2 family efflux MFS transporter permease subunit n=1 Tax=Corynebacterium casei TaxID=160386 RepID=UPI002648DF89|nr:DHA2 family efflux MFS transporter permease subunit [Corynebacterium casei]MDN5800171.1 DHA2 family efflux MFS transporter permease subunit [Corynebacterium casei]MDN5826949.1 DHA2 family efflux MFS transporter permease subunit [Corynebacterium casei]MDN5922792.1 DHA2 family efflux MFS transporter permease subunit [Corynebacterium casei]MDN6286267.1 DHA2 family efflux MFS transporter permease subunit [Corynebacterium casei]MDN6311859.1 DHA2 family efflux MFS transporter permease subunit [Co
MSNGKTTPSPQIAKPQAWRALAALCLGFFMVLMDQTIVAVATPDIMANFDTEFDQVVWVTSIYLLCMVVPLLFTGRLGDRFGQARMFQLGITVFVLAALAASLAPNLAVLLIARAVQGLGAAILTPQTMAVINRIFPQDARGPALGVWGAVGSVASLVGPVLGGFIISTFGWRGVFVLHLPLGIAALVLSAMWVPRLPTYARSIDKLSVVVTLVGMSAAVIAIQQGPGLGWPWWTIVLLIAGIALIAWFVRLQATATSRNTEPLVPLPLFKNRNYSLGAFSISTMGFAVASQMLPIMMWFQTGRGLTSAEAGLMMVPMAVAAGLGSPLVGPLADRIKPRLLSVIGFASVIASLVWIAGIMYLDASLFWFVGASALLGVGNAFVWAPNSVTAMRTVDLKYMGAASGVYNTTRQVGAVVGAAAVGAAMQVGAASLGLSQAMAVSLLLPALVMVAGLIAVACFENTLGPKR